MSFSKASRSPCPAPDRLESLRHFFSTVLDILGEYRLKHSGVEWYLREVLGSNKPMYLPSGVKNEHSASTRDIILPDSLVRKLSGKACLLKISVIVDSS